MLRMTSISVAIYLSLNKFGSLCLCVSLFFRFRKTTRLTAEAGWREYHEKEEAKEEEEEED